MDVNESSFRELVAVFMLNSMEDLIIEEDKLHTELCFFDVQTARNFYKTLVLSRMQKEAKLRGVDLKPLYTDQA